MRARTQYFQPHSWVSSPFKFLYILSIFLCSLAYLPLHASATQPITIDHVTLLLPSHVCNDLPPVSHKVKASGGCFTWITSSPHVVSVTPTVTLPTGPYNKQLIDANPSLCYSNGQWGSIEATIMVVPSDTISSPIVSAPASATTDTDSVKALAGQGTSNTAAVPYVGRRSAWIWAEDLASGVRAECEVFVDSIASMIIGTSTRRINVGDIESLSIQAFARQGDLFATVEGLAFSWSSSAERVARRLSFKESNLDTTPTRHNLEMLRFGSDRLPIQGMTPGRSNLTVEFSCPGEPTVRTSVEMLVTEPIGIFPTLLRMCPSTSAPFTIFSRTNKNRLKNASSGRQVDARAANVIRMPSTQYKWVSLDPNVVMVDRDSGKATSHDLLALPSPTSGSVYPAQVAVEDLHISEQTLKVDVVVVVPHRIEVTLHRLHDPQHTQTTPVDATLQHALSSGKGLTNERHFAAYDEAIRSNQFPVLPQCDGSYHLSNSKRYTAKIAAYDRQGRTINFCDGVLLSTVGSSVTVLPSDNVARIAADADGKQRDMTVRLRDTSSSVTILASDTEVGTTIIRVTAPGGVSMDVPVIVSNDISMSRTSIVLPKRDSVNNAGSDRACETPLSVVAGGSGSFLWTIRNPLLASVDQSHAKKVGNLKQNRSASIVSGSEVGESFVDVRDRCNPDNRYSLPLIVSVPAQLCLLTPQTEVLVGSSFVAEYAVKDNEGRAFTDCSCLNLSVSVDEGSSVRVRSSSANASLVASNSSKSVYTVGCSNECQVPSLADETDFDASKLDESRTISTQDSTARNSTCSCFTVPLIADAVGFSRVTARVKGYSLSDASFLTPITSTIESSALTVFSTALTSNAPADVTFSGFKPIVSMVFSVYAPLKTELPEVIAAVGSSVSINWANGPLPWPCQLNGFYSPYDTTGSFSSCAISHVDPTVRVLPRPSVGFGRSRPVALLSSRLDSHAYDHTEGSTSFALTTAAHHANNQKQNVTSEKERNTHAPFSVGRTHSYEKRTLEVTCLAPSSADSATDLVITTGNSACASLPRPATSSTTVSVKCFPPVCSATRIVSLAIGQTHNVTLAGYTEKNPHPLASKITYSVEDPLIASVDRNGNIIGKALGVTVVHIRVRHPSLDGIGWGADGLHDIMIVRVVFEGFQIEAPSVLRQGLDAVVSIRGLRGESPTHASFSMVDVDWKVENGSANAAVSLQPLTSSPQSFAVANNAGSQVQSAFTKTGWSNSPVDKSNKSKNSSFSLITKGSSVRLSSVKGSGTITISAIVRVAYGALSQASSSAISSTSGRKSPCAGLPSIGGVEGVSQYTISHTITILPTLEFTSPAPVVSQINGISHISTPSLLLPPGARFVLGSTLDASNSQTVSYSVSHEKSAEAVSINGTQLLVAPKKGLIVDSILSVQAKANIPSSDLLAENEGESSKSQDQLATLIEELTQVRAAAVRVRPPRSLDVLTSSDMVRFVSPAQNEWQPSSGSAIPKSESSSSNVPTKDSKKDSSFSLFSYFSGSKQASQNSDESVSIQENSHSLDSHFLNTVSRDPTVYARAFVSNDYTAEPALLEPLCPVSGTVIDNQRMNVSNVTLHVIARDIQGQIFDSLSLSNIGTITVQSSHPEIVSVSVVALSPSFTVSSTSAVTPLSTTVPTTPSPAVAISLAITAVAYGSESVLSSPVVVSVHISHNGFTNVLPVMVSLQVGSQSLCQTPHNAFSGVRLAIPINTHAIPTPLQASPSSNLFTQSWSALDNVDASIVSSLLGVSIPVAKENMQVLENTRTSFVHTLRSEVESTLLKTIADLDKKDKDTTFHGVPAFQTYVRSIDVTSGLALVDIVPVLPLDAASFDSNASTLTHLHQWIVRSSDVKNQTSLAVLVSEFARYFSSSKRREVVDDSINLRGHSSTLSSVAKLILDFSRPIHSAKVEYPVASMNLLVNRVLQVLSTHKTQQSSQSSLWPFNLHPVKTTWNPTAIDTANAIRCLENLVVLHNKLGDKSSLNLAAKSISSLYSTQDFALDLCSSVVMSVDGAHPQLWLDALLDYVKSSTLSTTKSLSHTKDAEDQSRSNSHSGVNYYGEATTQNQSLFSKILSTPVLFSLIALFVAVYFVLQSRTKVITPKTYNLEKKNQNIFVDFYNPEQ